MKIWNKKTKDKKNRIKKKHIIKSINCTTHKCVRTSKLNIDNSRPLLRQRNKARKTVRKNWGTALKSNRSKPLT